MFGQFLDLKPHVKVGDFSFSAQSSEFHYCNKGEVELGIFYLGEFVYECVSTLEEHEKDAVKLLDKYFNPDWRIDVIRNVPEDHYKAFLAEFSLTRE